MLEKRRGMAAVVAVGILLVAVPPFLPSYPLTLLTQAIIFAIFAMSLDLLLGFTGLPSLGHAAYFGVAAYVVAIFTTEYQAGFWTCLILALLAAVVTAAAFGLIAIRALGTYFLMITLALGMVVWGLAFRWVSLTKGDNGIADVPRPSLGLPWSFANQTAFYYLAFVTFLLAFALLFLIVRSPFGMSLRGIRESERRMRSLGYNVWLHKYLAFILAGAFAGLSGVLWAYYNGFVSPVEVQLITSVEALLMVAMGGPGTLVGPILGAGAIVFLKNFVSVYTKRWLLILGGVYICVILFTPQGILGALRDRGTVAKKFSARPTRQGEFVHSEPES
jgi:branched-chain amino acid transport system permease protein